MINKVLRIVTLGGFAGLISISAISQRYLAELDSSLFIKDTIRPFLKRFENLRFTGYIQPQFQAIQSKGAKSYGGGDFSEFSSSRFMLRRARIKLDYLVPDSNNKWAKALFTFQFDVTERGANVRDMFVRLYDGKMHLFSLTGGLFARPYGFEVNLSSAFRESPERGRMSQILMPVERDLGVMFSFEPQNRHHKLGFLKIDAGIFNGPGLPGTTEFDNRKDFISRIAIKPVALSDWEISGGLSLLSGGWRQGTRYVYTMDKDVSGNKFFKVDSSASNLGKISPRQYYGSDVQIKLNHAWGATEWRAEYWMGKQPGTAVTSVSPGTLPRDPVYRRSFNGGIFYFLQTIINKKNQVILKYDWYDPNTKISGNEIGAAASNTSSADVRYSTIGVGYAHYLNQHLRFIIYYDIIKNEKTQVTDYLSDKRDNLLTCRMQFSF